MSHLVPIAFKVVVEGELCASWDVLDSKQTNCQLVICHRPLLCLAVWVTRMVDEASQVALQVVRRQPNIALSGARHYLMLMHFPRLEGGCTSPGLRGDALPPA